jgi:spermidine synthase
MDRRLLLIAFFISNFSSLVYEVVWVRQFSYIFGTTVYATATVLSCFMAGLALGSFVLGKVADRSRNPLAVFIILEFGIGIYGFLTQLAFKLLPLPYLFLHNLFGASVLFPVSYFFLALLTLIIPTTFIGGTFPLVGRIYSNYEELGEGIGRVYFADTAGAALGAFIAGFLLVPVFGHSVSVYLAASLNVLAGCILYSKEKSVKIDIRDFRGVFESPLKELRTFPPLARVILLAFFFSGFAALIYEVTWTRLLSLTIGTSLYAFSIILGAFLMGLGVGSYLIGKYADRVSAPVSLFAFVEMGIGLLGIGLIVAFGRMDIPYLLLHGHFSSYGWFMVAVGLLTFLLLLLPTTLMGATLPLVSRIFTREKGTIGTDVGGIFSINTFGGIFGSFAAGFILVPVVGAVKTCLAASLLNMIIGYMVFLNSEKKARGIFYLILIAVVVSAGVVNGVNPVDLTKPGVYFIASEIKDIGEWKNITKNREAIYTREGIYGVVSISRTESSLSEEHVSLLINGKPDASTSKPHFGTQYLIANIPMLLHGGPKEVLGIGLGAGFTLRAMEDFDVDGIDLIEINPLVVEGAEYFSTYNNNALEDPRVNVIIADARNYLFTSPKKYDVIVSVPSNPWVSGEGTLFTREFYKIVGRHLNEGGIFAQWAGLNEYDMDGVKTFVRTFSSAFPYTTVWLNGADIMLLGSFEPVPLDYSIVREEVERNERVKAGLLEVFEGTYTDLNLVDFVFSHQVYSQDDVEGFGRNGKINSDDRPILEFSTTKASAYPTGEDMAFKILYYKYNATGERAIVPKVSNILSRDGEGIHMRFLNLNADMDLAWEEVFAGYRFKYNPVPDTEPPLYTKSYSKYAEFEKDGTKIRFDSFESAVVFLHGERIDMINEEVRGILEYRLAFLEEEMVGERGLTVNGHPAYEVYGRAHGKKSRVVAWYCPENKEIYVVSIDFKEEPPELQGIIDSLECVHTT